MEHFFLILKKITPNFKPCNKIYNKNLSIIAFVELSQICTELAQRFQLGNNKNASDELHNQLSLITQGNCCMLKMSIVYSQ